MTPTRYRCLRSISLNLSCPLDRRARLRAKLKDLLTDMEGVAPRKRERRHARAHVDQPEVEQLLVTHAGHVGTNGPNRRQRIADEAAVGVEQQHMQVAREQEHERLRLEDVRLPPSRHAPLAELRLGAKIGRPLRQRERRQPFSL